MNAKPKISTKFTHWRASFLALFVVLALLFAVVEPALAAVAYGSHVSNQNGNSNSITINKPTGVVTGSFMLAQITFIGGTAVTPGVPTGWNLVVRTDNGTSIGQAIYYKVAGASEPANYQWTFGSNRRAGGGIIRYTGVDTSDPIVDSGGNSASTVTLTAPSVDAEADSMLVSFFGRASGVSTLSTPGGMTSRYSESNQMRSMAADQLIGAAGATGTRESNPSFSSGVAWVAQNVTLRPAPPPGVTVDPTSVNVTEGGATATYTVKLDTPPTADVVITVSGDAQASVSPTPLTFTTANWATAQTVTVTAVDDGVVEGAHAGTITHAATSSDATYNGITIADVTANITDNDAYGVTVAPASVSVTEGGASATYDVKLNSQPSDDVVITVSGDAQATASPTPLTFTALNWNTNQQVTVTAVDDGVVEGAHIGTISHVASSSDANYNGISVANVTANITDNDSYGVTVSPVSVDVTEGGATATYDVKLNSQPSDDVVITVSGDAQATASPTPLTFTALNWNTNQQVTVTAVNDGLVEGAHSGTISHVAGSSDANYNGISISNVTANITDNDTASVTIDPTTVSVTEGGAGVDYTVVLNAQPTQDVTINISPDAQSTVSPTSLTFTSGNWNTPQPVTVTALNDSVAEGNHPSAISHSSTSADTNFNTLTIAGVTANITDNDAAGVTVDPTTVSVTEGQPGATYTVVLTSQPTGDVAITLSPDLPIDVSPDLLEFTPANWNVPQTVTVTPVDDSVAEGPHSGAVTHSAASSDAAYQAISIATVTANITDNDVAGVTISTATIAVTEGGLGVDYTVVLTSEPLADVTIAITSDPQTDRSHDELIFTPGDWNTPQTVTITALDDVIVEGPQTGSVSHSATSADTTYHSIAIAGIVVNITDNDTAGVTITPTSLSVAEGATGQTYTVVLLSQPTQDVLITITGDAQSFADAPSLTFTAADWDTPQVVTVTAFDDNVAEGAHSSTISHAATSADGIYHNFAVASIGVSITDNDTAGVNVTETGVAVSEGGATATYQVVLTSQPTQDVTINVTGDTQASVDVTTLTFTSANWNAAQTVTVSAVNDAIVEGPHSGAISHSITTSDLTYQALTVAGVAVTISDDDIAGVSVTPTVIDITEGVAGVDYAVALTSQPAQDVTVTLTGDSQATLSAASLTFTPANWNVAQLVTVTAVNDDVVEGAHTSVISHAADSADTNYQNLTIAGVTANIADNDSAGVTIAPITVSASEGLSTGSYQVSLTSQPTQDVTVNLSSDAQSTASPTSLIFTPADWNVSQTVTVTPVDDPVIEGAHTSAISHASTSTDPNYEALTIDGVTANITDNDSAGVTIDPTSVTVFEGGAAAVYTAVLTAQPTADVVVTIITDTLQANVSPTSLTFDAGNWNVAQNVTVSAVDDPTPEGTHTSAIGHTSASGDANFDLLTIAGVTANIVDNDAPGVSVIPTAVDVTEGGTTGAYQVVLNTLPTADVVITLAPDLAQTTVAPTPLTFTPADWNVAQSVTVTAVDDLVAEGPHTSAIGHSAASSDLDYLAIAIDDVTANITDNDTPGVTVTPTSINLAEGGASVDYTVALDSQPAGDVTISIITDTQSAVSPASLVFNSGNWNTPQTVTATAVDDHVAEGAHNSTIQHSAASSDGNYQAIAIDSVSAAIADNDTAGVSVAPATVNAAEGGATATYQVQLTSQPTADVTVNISGDAQAGVNLSTLTFTPLNWNTSQSVTVSAVDDGVVEGAHSGAISHVAASTDLMYNAITVAGVAVNITDNDTAGVSVTPTSVNVAEGGTTANYTVVLSSQPSNDVTISISADAQSTASAASLLFTAANWDSAQTVTVTAADDDVDEGAHTSAIGHSASSSDANYNGLSVAGVTANITDNDSAAVDVAPTSVDVVEGGATDTYQVLLESQPTANVVVAITHGAQITATPASLTFTPANWNVAQEVTVEAEDDSDVEGAHSDGLTHTATSSDAKYNGVSVASVAANITDNDSASTPGVSVTPTSVNVAEGGATATYSVKLNSAPSADVVIAVTSDAQTSVSPASLTFTGGNWDVAQTVTVSAVDDGTLEGVHASMISHSASSSDSDYNGIAISDVSATVGDNDGAAVMAAPTSLSISEPAGAAVFTVTLGKAPTAAVTVNLSTSDAGECSVAASISLDAANWQTGVAVTVNAVDDAIDDGAQPCTIKGASSSSDAAYEGLAMNELAVTVADDDTASLAVDKTATPRNAAIGDTITYRFRITNTGTVALSGVVAIDDKLGAITLDRTTLQPGQLARATILYVIQASDLPGPLNNTVNVTANSAGGNPVSGSDSASVRLATSGLLFTKTVGIAGIVPECTTNETMTVPASTAVVYCYTVRNVGTTVLTSHTLVDSHLGTLLNNAPYVLAAGASYSVTITAEISVDTTNVATWTASVGAIGAQVDPADVAQNVGSSVNTSATVLISKDSDDQDGDTIPDNVEGAEDVDDDNVPNFLDTDSDDDGFSDEDEAGPDPTNPQDSDGDGVPDYLDRDQGSGGLGPIFLPLVSK